MMRSALILGLTGLLFSPLLGQEDGRKALQRPGDSSERLEHGHPPGNEPESPSWQESRPAVRLGERPLYRERHFFPGGPDAARAQPQFPPLSPSLSDSVHEAWVARYNGSGNQDDGAHAIAVDDAGNVYVTGNSRGSGTDYDYTTVKYDSNGVQLWEARYNGPGNSEDDATALAVDGAGNVYVTGSSFGSGTMRDYATVKYDAFGTQQWVVRNNGPGNNDDIPTALAVDSAGNVYVTGWICHASVAV